MRVLAIAVLADDPAAFYRYSNAQLQKLSPSTTGTMAAATQPFNIGGAQGIGRGFAGTLDEVAIYTHVLSSERIAAHYHVVQPQL
jgi:hypothetical protein